MVPLTSALRTPWFLKAQLWTYPVVLTVMEARSNFICKGCLEVFWSNPLFKPWPDPKTHGVALHPIQSTFEYLKDGKHSALPVQLLRATSQPLRKTRALFISCNSNCFWLKPNKTAKHVSTPIIHFRNCLKTGQKPMTHLTYRRWEYIMWWLVFHISIMITAVIDASTTN